jgi:hypothetical protein
MSAQRVVVALAIAVVCVLSPAIVGRAGASEPGPGILEIQTLPALPGMAFALDGQIAVSDLQGVARIQVERWPGVRDRIEVLNSDVSEGVRAKLARWYGDPESSSRKRLTATFNVYYLVSPTFVDLEGNPVAPERITSLTLKSSHGVSLTFDDSQPQWLQGNRVVPLNNGLFVKDIYWNVESVVVNGSNVVNRSQQRFFPSRSGDVRIQVLFYSARFHAHDALFRFPIGSGVALQYPDKRIEHFKFDSSGELTLESLPRGDYKVSVDGPGISLSRPVAVSRDQDISLDVISYLDLAFLLFLAAAVGFGVVLIPRSSLVRRKPGLHPGLAARLLHRGVASATRDRQSARPAHLGTFLRTSEFKLEWTNLVPVLVLVLSFLAVLIPGIVFSHR